MAQQILVRKNAYKARASIQQEVRRNIKAWDALRGIWRGKKILDPVQWQKKIRKEWERTLP